MTANTPTATPDIESADRTRARPMVLTAMRTYDRSFDEPMRITPRETRGVILARGRSTPLQAVLTRGNVRHDVGGSTKSRPRDGRFVGLGPRDRVAPRRLGIRRLRRRTKAERRRVPRGRE